MARQKFVPVLGFMLGLMVCAAAPAQEPSKKVPAMVLKTSRARFVEKADERLLKETPKDGYITDQKAWAKLWNAWRWSAPQKLVQLLC